MFGPVTTRSLDPILRGVSRSIFLTLRLAPGATRRQLGIAYLFCRAADTIADTRLLPPAARLDHLRRLRGLFAPAAGAAATGASDIETITRAVEPAQAIPEERQLLLRLAECFAAHERLQEADRARIRKLVTTLTRGMEMDLERFPAEESGRAAALEADADLDLYTYYVAGCVGAFWTELHAGHLRALRSWDLAVMVEKGIRFGKGLQMTNILRDVGRDLAIGRCYFPRSRLEPLGLSAEALARGEGRDGLQPLLRHYLGETLAHYRAGWEYTLAVPRSAPRLRLACALPLLLGLRTLALLGASANPYAPGTHHKVPRREVYSLLRRAASRIFSRRRLDALYRELEAGILHAEDPHQRRDARRRLALP